MGLTRLYVPQRGFESFNNVANQSVKYLYIIATEIIKYTPGS